MNKHQLQVILEDCGYECDSYSGRSMYGKSCLAVYPKKDIGNMFADIIGSIENTGDSDEHHMEPYEYLDVSNAFRNMRTDTMGKGMVVYFPTVEYFDDNEDEEESDGEL